MRRGAHAADDGSFNRSAAIHTGRAAVLLVVAFLIGVGLLHSADRSSVSIGTTSGTTVKKTTTTSAGAVETTTTLAPRDPRTVKVLAANGSSTNGVGDKLRKKLLALNYDALNPAVTATTKTRTSAVYFTAGFESEAAALASAMNLPTTAVHAMPTKAPVAQLLTANLLIVAGDDIVASLTSTTTTTSVKGTTGTTTKRTTTTSKSGTTTTTTKASSSSSSSSTTTTR